MPNLIVHKPHATCSLVDTIFAIDRHRHQAMTSNFVAGHSAQCSIMSLKTRSANCFTSSRPPTAPRLRSCACHAQQRYKSGKLAGMSMLPWLLAVPASIAEDVIEQAQGAVEQGKQVAEQAQQQFKLPSDLQYPSGAGVRIPKELPSTSGLEDYVSHNPAVVAAGVAVVAIGLVIARLVGQGVSTKKITAAKAFDMLSEDNSITFVDLRSKAELNESGSPDLRSIKKKITSLPYTTVSIKTCSCPKTMLIARIAIALSLLVLLTPCCFFRAWQAI